MQPLPPSPLESENNEALPPPWEQHFAWKFYQGQEEGLALLFQCLLQQEGADSLGPRKTRSRSPWKPASPWPSLVHPQRNLFW